MKAFLKFLARPINLLWLALLAAAVWAVKYLPVGEIWATLRSLDPFNLAVWLSFNILIVLILCLRWWWIIRLQGYRLSLFKTLAYRLVGYSISYFSPGTQFGGEPLQVYYLEKREGLPRAEALASVTLDKLFELLSNFTFLAAGTLFVLNRGTLITIIPKNLMLAMIAGLLLLPLLYLVGLWVGQRPLTWLAARLPTRLKKRGMLGSIHPLVAAAENRIGILIRQKPAGLAGVFVLSGVIWMLFIAEYWLMLWILGVDPAFTDAISGLTALRLSFLSPIPGGLGALEASQVLAAKWMGLGTAVGISASLLIRGRDITLGLFGFLFGSLFSRSQVTSCSPSPYGDIS